MPSHHLDEERIAPRRPDGSEVSDRPDRDADQPEAEAETERCRECPVHDGNGARGAAEQDRLGQGAMDGRDETQEPVRPSDHGPAAEAEEGEEE